MPSTPWDPAWRDEQDRDGQRSEDAAREPSDECDSEELVAHLNPASVTKSGRRRRRARTVPPSETRRIQTGAQRVAIIEAWERSGMTAPDFSMVCGVPRDTLYAWRTKFRREGARGLENKVRARRGSRLPEEVQEAIRMLKAANPEWGAKRISAVLARAQNMQASAPAVLRVLKAAGYVVEQGPSRRHPDKPRRFERARPNQMWQTDLFSFTLKRTARRVHLVAFMDDHSRLITSFGLHASPTTALVQEALLAGIARYGPPEEVLTDNGPQYVTWRGKSAFSKLCEHLGIHQVVARPRRPQTLGKIERFWSSLWQECLREASLTCLDEARDRISRYLDHYNLQRPHQGIDGLVPADRFFSAAPQVKAALDREVAARTEGLDRGAEERPPLYLTGRIGDQAVSVHVEGEQLVVVKDDGQREALALTPADPELDQAEAPEPPVPLDDQASASSAPAREAAPAALAAPAAPSPVQPAGDLVTPAEPTLLPPASPAPVIADVTPQDPAESVGDGAIAPEPPEELEPWPAWTHGPLPSAHDPIPDALDQPTWREDEAPAPDPSCASIGEEPVISPPPQAAPQAPPGFRGEPEPPPGSSPIEDLIGAALEALARPKAPERGAPSDEEARS